MPRLAWVNVEVFFGAPPPLHHTPFHSVWRNEKRLSQAHSRGKLTDPARANCNKWLLAIAVHQQLLNQDWPCQQQCGYSWPAARAGAGKKQTLDEYGEPGMLRHQRRSSEPAELPCGRLEELHLFITPPQRPQQWGWQRAPAGRHAEGRSHLEKKQCSEQVFAFAFSLLGDRAWEAGLQS